MKSVEDAYQCIGANLIKGTNQPWVELALQTKILGKNCSAMTTEQVSVGDSIRCQLELGFAGVFEVNDACIFLRDNLLATTGQRIWGLTFTLYPDGKFNIRYDYNKPEGYEETDEVITGDEINQALDAFGNKLAS